MRSPHYALERLESRTLLTGVDWDDPPPDPRSTLFHVWADNLLDHYADLCTSIDRTTTYHFANSGNDITGDGSEANPFQTRLKAQELINASAGMITLLFRRGDTWSEGFEFGDNEKNGIEIGAYGVGSNPVFDGSNQLYTGITLSGDGSFCWGITSQNWGNASDGPQNWCFKSAASSGEVNLFQDAVAGRGGFHTIGLLGGGVSMYRRVEFGGTTKSNGGPAVFYSDAGGHTALMDDCVATSGAPGGSQSAVYAHTDGLPGHYMGMMLIRDLYVNGDGLNPFSGSVQYREGPLATTITDARVWEIGTYMEPGPGQMAFLGLGGIIASVPDRGVQINGRYYQRPVNYTHGAGLRDGWVLNCLFDTDLQDVVSVSNWGFGNKFTGQSPFSPQIDHSQFVYRNVPAGLTAGLEYAATYAEYDGTAGFRLTNSIVSKVGTTGSVVVGLRDAVGTVGASSHNGYFGLAAEYVGTPQYGRGAHDLDDNPIELSIEPIPLAEPQPALSDAGVAGGVPLEYDINLRPRSLTSPNVGPVEGTAQPGPVVTSTEFHYETSPQKVKFKFDRNVSLSLGLEDVLFEKIGGGSVPALTLLPFGTDGPNIATFVIDAPLADGNYRITLAAAGIVDPISQSQMGLSEVVTFFILAADANRDRRVDVHDLTLLAANWLGTGKTFGQGDFNYDGVVNKADLGMMATRWHQKLDAPPPASPPVTTAARRTPVRTPTRVSQQVL